MRRRVRPGALEAHQASHADDSDRSARPGRVGSYAERVTTPPPPPPAAASSGQPPAGASPGAQMSGVGSAPRRPAIVWDIVVTLILLVCLGILTLITSYFGLFLAMASDPCGGTAQCDTDLIGLGVLAAVGLPWIVLLIAAVVAIVLLVKRRLAFWVPLLAAPLTIASWFVGAAMASAGVP
ncbi:DUF6264 family protein [Microbacterium sp. zg-B185]|uniref:DUF6264 family protein n=1 Tax=Microbacterium sp. zg-B185 TaxID=3049070 RepID=UPI00254E3E71|nr:DUF6264 family protein [Microbacterium sp. zg-B185]WIM20962.1 DUF6264 family protein [Microbacterium sp. zg-B185]